MIKQLLAVMFVLILVLGFSLQADATLELRGTDSLGNRLIYDSDRNITWYDYTKSGAIWQNQMDWASALTVNFNGTIFDDWRLPSAGNNPSCCYNNQSAIDAEMGHVYYVELGNLGFSEPGYGLVNVGPFINLSHSANARYYTNTSFIKPGYLRDDAWHFKMADGGLFYDSKVNTYLAMAVRAGDVAVVPEPISSILFITGGVTLIGRKYIRGKKRGITSHCSERVPQDTFSDER